MSGFADLHPIIAIWHNKAKVQFITSYLPFEGVGGQREIRVIFHNYHQCLLRTLNQMFL